jgi:hypothetical protein
MTPVCRRCDEPVHTGDRVCPSCGADLRVQVPVLVDLTRRQAAAQRDRHALLAEVLSGTAEAEPTPKPVWGEHTATMLKLELAPVRIGRGPSADDVLPAARPAKRGWRRR